MRVPPFSADGSLHIRKAKLRPISCLEERRRKVRDQLTFFGNVYVEVISPCIYAREDPLFSLVLSGVELDGVNEDIG